ncbi:MAG: cytochrome c biogenesis protein CcdA, partial [Clostridia bacterium]|nr:cytochrome c biogenesis protein CcdA [Clostridia bacterium]
LSSILFGMIFSVGWTPCVGTFLGSALMMASGSGKMLEGTLMLLVYSLGLGIPFMLCAILLDRMKNIFSFIKRNYKVINTVCGIFLIIVGLAMATGFLGRLLYALS